MINNLKLDTFVYVIIIYFFLLLSKTYSVEKNFIEVKVNNNIITKSDIINEKNY